MLQGAHELVHVAVASQASEGLLGVEHSDADPSLEQLHLTIGFDERNQTIEETVKILVLAGRLYILERGVKKRFLFGEVVVYKSFQSFAIFGVSRDY